MDRSAPSPRAPSNVDAPPAREAPAGALAILGMACRLPGGVEDPDALWQLVHDGVDATCEIPADRWDADRYYAPGRQPGKMYTRRGGFVTGLGEFDARFFGISGTEATSMDPQQRVLLEICWAALEDAGIAPQGLAGTRTGVFVGITSDDFLATHRDALAFGGVGAHMSIAAGRLSYHLDLRGPAMAVDTACSASLVALHLACKSLQHGECDLALVGGVNAVVTPNQHLLLSDIGALSPDGRCKAFAASADGFGRAEGCGMIVLARHADARAAGHRVRALVRATALNHDGRSSTLIAPSQEAQAALLRDILSENGLTPDDINYVETHGTGTPVGDPIEFEAMREILGGERVQLLRLGAVKSNLGHLESAAGMAALIKSVLSLERSEIPPNLHVDRVNPRIDLRGTGTAIVTERVPWQRPPAGPRLVGVSGFGFAGTNAHALLQEHLEEDMTPPDRDRSPHLLCLSARTDTALAEMARRYERHLREHPSLDLADVCFTASAGRSHFEQRAAMVVGSREQAVAALGTCARGESTGDIARGQRAAEGSPRVAFLFTGQGAQYAGMGKSLYQREPVFREALDACAAALHAHLPRPLLEVMFAGDDDATIHETRYAQPALFSLEYALSRLWASWGVEPWAVLGHSVGELAAACVAGAMELADGLALIAARGRLMQELPRNGTMVAVRAGLDEVREALRDHRERVSIAAVNGPRSTVISGEREAVAAVVAAFEQARIQARELRVSHAFHSALMEPMLDELEAIARGVHAKPPRCRLISNLTGTALAEGQAPDASYWRRHVREPVLFEQGMRALAEAGVTAFLEIGPQPTLTGMARMFLDGGEAAWITSMRPDHDESEQILAGAAQLYAHGVDLDWAGFHRDRGGRKVALPTYPFERKRYWISSDRPGRHQDADAALLHPLLGRRLPAALATIPFLAELGPDAPAYLDHHRVHGMPVFPGTGYVELALAAARAVRGDGPCLVRNLSFERALVLPEGSRRRIQVLLTPAVEGRFTFEIHSQAVETRDGAESPWHLHARGDIAPLGAPEAGTAGPGDLRAWKQRLTEAADVAAQYRELTAEGLEYGPAFQGLTEAWTAAAAPGEALAAVRLPPEAGEDAAGYLLHPALLDACLQAIAAARRSQAAPDGDTYLPVGVDEIRFYQSATEVFCHVGLAAAGHGAPGLISASIDVVDGQGRPVARLRGVTLQRVDRSALRRLAELDVRDWFYEITWQKLPAAAATPEPAVGTWLVLADAGGTGRAVADALTRAGQRCVVVDAPPDPAPDLATDLAKNPPGAPGDAADPAAFDRIVATASEQGGLRGVIHLWALDAHAMRATSAGALAGDAQRICASALHLVQALGRAGGAPPALVLVTRGAQHVLDGDCVAAAQTSLWGLGRVIALEHPEYRCRLIDLDGSSAEQPGAAPGAAGAPEADAAVLVSEIWRDGSEPQVALRGGQRHGARLTRARKLGTEAEERLSRPAGESFALETERPGILEALTLRPAPRPGPGAGEIEVEVGAAGLNFRDVMNAMGAYPGGPEPLGGECAGRVTALGDGVQGFAVGDEVVVGLTRGAFRRFAIADARFVAHRPAWLDAAAAVTLPITFLTAVYGLDHLAGLRAGERVLIHAGAGGVGLAAIQLARRAGAEIFATAGSPRKRDFLRGLGVDHVLDSRSLAFADQIRAITGGRGVDVVLNSLAGEFITRSMSLLGPGGRFIELGKVDILDPAAVPAGIAYHHFDLGEECERDGSLWQKMFAELLTAIETGALRPLPREVYAIEEARSAFRYMAQGRHIGKLVLTIDRADGARGQALHPRARIAEDGAYLVTGGLGGLGLEVARWLVERGAGQVVLMSRKAAPDELLARIRELAGPAGDRVTVAQGDVSRAEDVERVLGAIAHGSDSDGAGRPPERRLRLRGVVHAAGLVEDATLARQRWDGFARVMAPKVLGGWHLHRLTRDLDLDFFVVFSSMTAMLGNAGQGNYAAANAFLDALVHYRRGLGLPGIALDWGIWREVGMAAADPARRLAPLEARGIDGIGPDEGMAAMEALLASRLVQVGILPVDWSRYLGGAADRAPALLAQLASAAVRLAPAVKAAPAVTPERVEEALLAEIRRVLDLGESERIDPGEPLERLGLDSLMAVELRNRLGQMLGTNLPATILFDYPSIDALAGYIRADVLQAPAEQPAEAAPEAPAGGDKIAAILAAIDALSDDEQQQLLETLLEGDE